MTDDPVERFATRLEGKLDDHANKLDAHAREMRAVVLSLSTEAAAQRARIDGHIVEDDRMFALCRQDRIDGDEALHQRISRIESKERRAPAVYAGGGAGAVALLAALWEWLKSGGGTPHG